MYSMRMPFSLTIRVAGLLVTLAVLLLTTSCIRVVKPVQVPVDLNSTTDVGSLVFDLVYDYEVLQVAEVKPGNISADAIIQFNTDNPGHVIVGIVDSGGIKSGLTVVTVVFKVLQKDRSCNFRIKDITAFNVDTLDPLSVTSNASAFDGESFKVTAPVISVNP